MSWMDDADIVPCGRCSKDVVMDHDPPCPHGWVACPECGWEAVCRECKAQAQADMFAGDGGVGVGEYNPKADPLLDHTAATAARDAAYWDQTRRGWWDLGRGPRPDEEDSA